MTKRINLPASSWSLVELFLDHPMTKCGLINHVNVMHSSFIMHTPPTISEQRIQMKILRKIRSGDQREYGQSHSIHELQLTRINQFVDYVLYCRAFLYPPPLEESLKGKVNLHACKIIHQKSSFLHMKLWVLYFSILSVVTDFSDLENNVQPVDYALISTIRKILKSNSSKLQMIIL